MNLDAEARKRHRMLIEKYRQVVGQEPEFTAGVLDEILAANRMMTAVINGRMDHGAGKAVSVLVTALDRVAFPGTTVATVEARDDVGRLVTRETIGLIEPPGSPTAEVLAEAAAREARLRWGLAAA